VNEIRNALGVSKSSVSLWVRDVELSDDARARLLAHTRLGPMLAAERRAENFRELRRSYQARGRAWVRELGPEYAAGCMLFWAEGSKNRNVAQLTNADPDLCAVFLRFLRTFFAVPDRKVALTCNLFADHAERRREIEIYWLTKLDLPESCLRKSIVNNYSKYSQKKRQNNLPYGTCRLTAYSTEIVQTLYGSIQEYGGFDRPEWLD